MNSVISNGVYRLQLIDESGCVKQEIEGKNLILNNLLNNMPSNRFTNLFPNIYAGDGAFDGVPKKLYIYNPSITAHQDGTTVTSSSSFFTSDMVNRTIHFEGQDNDCTIKTYVDSQNVTVNTNVPLTSDFEIAVWETNRTTLFNYLSALDIYPGVLTSTYGHLISSSGDEITFSRKYTFKKRPYSAAELVLNEFGIGLGPTNLSVMFVLDESQYSSGKNGLLIPENWTLVVNYQIKCFFNMPRNVDITTSVKIIGANDGTDPEYYPKDYITNNGLSHIGQSATGEEYTYVMEPRFANLSRTIQIGTKNINMTDGILTSLLNDDTEPQKWILRRTFTDVTIFSPPVTWSNINFNGFVAPSYQNTYLYKLGVTITIANAEDKVSFEFEWQWNRLLPDVSQL